MKKQEKGSSKKSSLMKHQSKGEPAEGPPANLKQSSSLDNLDEAPIPKTYISKSHENLSSFQKRKLSGLPHQRPKSSLGGTSQAKAGNKENVGQKETKTVTYGKSKTVKYTTPGSMRKASSTQSIDKAGSLVRSAVQNNKAQSMKRAVSTQNVQTKDKSIRNRTSAPAEVMSYNAELLANFEKEKKNLESRISDLTQLAESRKGEIEKYKIEIRNLRSQAQGQELEEEVEFLKNENRLLQDRLKELGHPVEQITDTQKLSMLKEASHSRAKSGSDVTMPQSVSFDNLSVECARGSVMGSVVRDGLERSESIPASEPGFSLADLCSSDHNWDKQSNKSSDAMSEVALQNLTERILEMEETHYSTNEELQATLQELGDLQDTVNRLTEENEDLAAERDLLFQSLHTQTRKLQNCRTQIEQLKSLLIGTHLPDKGEKEKQLEDLLKSAAEEREELLCLQKELGSALFTSENDNREAQDVVEALKDKVQLLEDRVKALQADKQMKDTEMTTLKESYSSDQIELTRYKTLLENEKSKVTELEQYSKAVDKSDLEELLHNTRTEKDKLEAKLTNIQEAYAHCQCEVVKLKDQLSRRDDELKVTKNNGKTQMDDLEYRMKNSEKEKDELQQENRNLREHIDQLDQDCDRYIEEKKGLEAKIQECRQELNLERKTRIALECKVREQQSLHEEQSEEWKQFQKDLQVAVVIANDFRSEKEQELDNLVQENTSLRGKCRNLVSELNQVKDELETLRAQNALEQRPSKHILSPTELKSPIDKELCALRENRQRHDSNKNQSLNVKSLIKSIEEQVKSGSSCPISSSRSSSRRNSESTDGPILLRPETDKTPVKENGKGIVRRNTVASESPVSLRSVLKKPTPERLSPLQRHANGPFDKNKSPLESPKSAPVPVSIGESEITTVSPSIASFLSRGSGSRRNSGVG